ncbi:MAG: hypothetical protein ABW007_03640 [Chitinophagaceae bacterium]
MGFARMFLPGVAGEWLPTIGRLRDVPQLLLSVPGTLAHVTPPPICDRNFRHRIAMRAKNRTKAMKLPAVSSALCSVLSSPALHHSGAWYSQLTLPALPTDIVTLSLRLIPTCHVLSIRLLVIAMDFSPKARNPQNPR